MTSYAIDTARSQILDRMEAATGSRDLEVRAAPPKVPGDLAVPLFQLAKEQGASPKELGARILEGMSLGGTLFEKAEVVGGFLNFHLAEDRYVARVLDDLARLGAEYGGSDEGGGRTVVIDYSSPNIAKPFSVGHLRSTNIGHSIAQLYRFLGYRVVGDNHIGDWGTQFGKLLAAYEVWGDAEKVEASPIQEMLALYVRFHEAAKGDPTLNGRARGWFRRLEDGEETAVGRWRWFRDLSWREFETIYRRLGVSFEEVLGESFYNDKLEAVVADAFEQGLAVWSEVPGDEEKGEGEDAKGSEGAETDSEETKGDEKVALISLEDEGIETPLLIQKSDGTSLYATRDLATIRHREEAFRPERILYVVGGEQQLYFRQLFTAARKLGHETPCEHVWFGLIRLPGGRMSTREGRVIFLEDVLDEAVRRAEEVLEDRDLSDDERRRIAEQVGVGAVKFADLAQTRTKDVLFDWDRMLSLSGDSAPYLQYAAVRIRSILRRAKEEGTPGTGDEGGTIRPELLTAEEEVALVRALGDFPDAVRSAAGTYQPHIVATYLVQLARAYHNFYNACPVLKAESPDLVAARLTLCRATLGVLVRGLDLLGIEAPEKM